MTVQATASVPELLRGVPMFAGASEDEIRSLAAVARESSYGAGAVVCQEGTTGVGLQVVASGTVLVYTDHIVPTRLSAGAYFGEIAVVDGGPRMSTVVAETAVTTLGILARDYEEILAEQPGIARRLLDQVCNRLRQLDASGNS